MPINYGGLQSYKADEVKIIDNQLDFKTVFFQMMMQKASIIGL